MIQPLHPPKSWVSMDFSQVGGHILGLQRELRGDLSLLLWLRGLKYSAATTVDYD